MTQQILIVEDDPAIQEMLQARLEMEGYSLSLARDGQEALEQLERAIPSIMLLDLEMPRMNGYVLLETLEKQRPGLFLPTLVITADPHAAAKLAHKPVILFPKPFSLRVLIAAIKEIMNALDT